MLTVVGSGGTVRPGTGKITITAFHLTFLYQTSYSVEFGTILSYNCFVMEYKQTGCNVTKQKKLDIVRYKKLCFYIFTVKVFSF